MPIYHAWTSGDRIPPRTLSALSERDAADIFLAQAATSEPPFDDFAFPPACMIQKDVGDGKAHRQLIATPYWLAATAAGAG